MKQRHYERCHKNNCEMSIKGQNVNFSLLKETVM